ncbi:AAA family ATPase [uncultured Dysosmobacter sp.]|uniref:AAA family ATPase n=1 Tax=uncultured Dysosmobacter sp. TaxID=2591384 RepID=UPI00261CCB52|nr:AAA family ATPase [uncultured Dysosmobacter sp.]
MEFEKAMHAASQYLTFTDRFLDPKLPQGLWFCGNVAEVSDIQVNAVCLGSGCEWNDVVKCQPFFEHWEYIVIVEPNAIAREELVRELRPWLPASRLYVVQDSGFQNCRSIREYIEAHGIADLPRILSGAVELPAYGILNLADIQKRDMTKVPRTLSRFDRLDKSIGGFFAGELSVWTGKRGSGKSTILSQILLEAVDQGHVVCAYSGELDQSQFREWAYLQAAGPDYITYRADPMTGKRLPTVDEMADQMISEWLSERFWLFDLEKNTRHDPEAILKQFAYAKMRYNADVFLVDNIMSVDFDYKRDSDFNRIQSQFTQMLATFSKRQHVHTHLVVHPRKSTSDQNGKVSADDVNGSADITNRADNVFFLTTHASTDDKGQPETKPLLMTLKNRDFGSHINQWLDFDKKSRRFFVDRTGDSKRPYGWDAEARQMKITEDRGDIDRVFPEGENST